MEKQIIDIARFLFDDDEFNKLINLFRNKSYSDIIAFVQEEKEITEILMSFSDDKDILLDKLNKLNSMENLLINSYLGVEVT